MTPSVLPWPLIAGLLLVLLSACTPGNVREDDATGDLGAIKEEGPGDIYAQMGREYMKAGQPSVALQKLKRGLKEEPDNAQVHAVLGLLYQQLNEKKLAAEHYRRASELAPQNPYYHNAWGGFLCQQQQYAEADEQFRLALRNPLYSRPWATYTNAGVCAYRAGHPEQAADDLRRALSANPRIPLALLKMAQIHYDQGSYTDARSYLQRYRDLSPHSPETLLLGLRIERALGDNNGITRYLLVLERRYPDAPETKTAKELTRP